MDRKPTPSPNRETLDIQKRKEHFPDPVAWVWTQLDHITSPDLSRRMIKTTVSIADTRSNSWAVCAVWRYEKWMTVWRVEAGQLHAVNAFTTHAIHAGQGVDVYDQEEIRNAVEEDVIQVQTLALMVIAPSWEDSVVQKEQ